jgi:hypothetical protein
MAYPIKFLDSTMLGAPVLDNNWGALTTMLDAVLVNGFNNQAGSAPVPDGITPGAFNVTVSSSHGFVLNQIVKLVGSENSNVNTEYRVTKVTLTVITIFNADLIGTTGLVNAVTVSTPPLGYGIIFTGTNKRVYKSSTPTASSMMLRVDNSLAAGWNAAYAKFGKISAAKNYYNIDAVDNSTEVMPNTYPTNEVLTGSGTTAINGSWKWYYTMLQANETVSENTARPWKIVGDGRVFYLFIQNGNQTWLQYGFGEYKSFYTSDTKNNFVNIHVWGQPANTSFAEGSFNTHGRTNSANLGLESDDYQTGLQTSGQYVCLKFVNGSMTSGKDTGVAYPDPCTNGINFTSVYCESLGNTIRGEFAGLKFINNNIGSSSAPQWIYQDGKAYLMVLLTTAHTWTTMQTIWIAFDITGNSNNSWWD